MLNSKAKCMKRKMHENFFLKSRVGRKCLHEKSESEMQKKRFLILKVKVTCRAEKMPENRICIAQSGKEVFR